MKNVSFEVYASAARTEAPTPQPLVNNHGNAGMFVFDITAVEPGASVQFALEHKLKAAAAWEPLFVGNVEAGVVRRTYLIGIGLPEVAGVSKNTVLPENLRVTIRHFSGDSVTYSLDGALSSSS